MTRREVVFSVLEHRQPPYVPWHFSFTVEAKKKLLDNFNPFQPEVMDIFDLLKSYKGRLTFHGGLSTQQLLPFGSPGEIRKESERLLKTGIDGGYIFAPSHAVEGDVPLENILAFIETAQHQRGCN